jgi:hypothetical protein
MKILVKEFNVEEQLRGAPPGTTPEPAVIVKRNQLQKIGNLIASKQACEDPWQILQVSLNDVMTKPGEATNWGFNNTGEFVRVPLFPYTLGIYDAVTILKFGLQLGALATEIIRPLVGEIDTIFLAVGNVVQRPEQPQGCTCWLGFALKKR